ncbi:high-affinity Fe2+/Pb2+ permease [Leifsonia xyli subsp. xyli]|uniref:Membrane protein n=2 Tax=Leifsonia xyli subsp. xyli TaxID=59736 RepID=Q6ADY1_LEIXX|nr:iron uptake transporter permease EfeU [Leifsonia xyli]AAT89415.1 membrane protein [Leifsonia xyli subsp. xyli str. CTCB07]ODA90582.1 high-affinity Fe2+/Pb2+ permease [Leifsonia xyli subsp. xyli]
MIANYLIGLREGLEMALIVTILVAYAAKTRHTGILPKLWLGVGVALVVPLGIGALLTWGPYGLSFEAQEAVGGALSLAAVGFVTWMILWMGKTAHSLTATLENRLDAALVGAGWGVVALAMLSVGREGVETALFVWATVASVGGGWEPIVGATLGLISAAVVGFLLYRGMVRINLGSFFAWTGAFLVVVAGGVLAYGLGDLQEAGILPGANIHAYDISGIVPASSWYGTALAGIVNFTPSPTWLQVVAWAGYIVVVSFLFLRQRRASRRTAPVKPQETAVAQHDPVTS